MEPFKNLLNDAVVSHAAHHLQRAWPAFDAEGFVHLATQGLAELEFKARADHIASALEATLPADFDQAASLLENALAPAHHVNPADEPSPTRPSDAGLAGWVLWPVGEFVARRGLAEPERALRALHALTQRFTAEFAIRPFIVAQPALVFDTLASWASDPSAHVRRLVSEGSRPRLPWGLRLQSLVADPSPSLPLLARLQDDPSEYVRRSVANHLNDIAKDHPQRLADWLETHLPSASPPRRALLRHASRSLIKQGDARVLALWGLGRSFEGQVQLQLAPAAITLGDSLQLSLTLLPAAQAKEQTLEIDYRVHHVKANGSSSPKVFKGWRLTLPPGQARSLSKAHAVKPISTRRYYPGRHRVDVQINGQVVAESFFDLTLPHSD